MAINGAALTATLAGAVLTYSGVKGKKISTTFKDLIAGQNPGSDPTVDVPIANSLNMPTDPTIDPTVGNTAVRGRMSARDIYTVARNAGFNPLTAVVATAIAFAESGGNPHSHNPVPPDDSYGLWQINMIGALGPARRAEFGLSSNDQLYDPATNARAAYAISSHGANFTPWTTYTSGAYRQYLGTARTAANG